MPNNTKHSSGAMGAVLAAAGTALVVILLVGSLLWTMLQGDAVPSAVGVMLVYGVFGAAVVIGVFSAMFQRLEEIRGGEADEARKY